MRTMEITAGTVRARARLNDSRTAEAIWNALPIRGQIHRWGDEIYFAIPLALPPEDPQEVVAAGDLAYWPPGQAICLFWGPTPASRGNEIRPASPVNVFGTIVGEAACFAAAPEGSAIELTRGATAPATEAG